MIQMPNEGLRINRCGATPLVINTWHYITGVYNASAKTLDVYLDGVKDNGGFKAGSPAVPSEINTPPSNQCIYIASAANQNNLLFGFVDEFRLYSRALSAAEIAELYRVSQ
jgi:hypothetical protein